MYIADLHIHSSYSRATSRDCDPEHLDLWARRKGIQLIGTGDFTHPAWRCQLKEKLVPSEDGLFVLREGASLKDSLTSSAQQTRFVLSAEISSIYKKNGRVRKVHNVILLPGFEAAEELSHRLEAIGNIHSDGRPILGLDSRDLLELTLETCPSAVFIPAHIWTPHFSLFGAFSGFDTIEECFEDLTPHIHALETGLSSDPPMNARISALDRFTLVSNSDAHSPSKLGREANLLDAPLSFPGLSNALEQGWSGGFLGTIEFFPEEGKYHFDGHRNCKLCLSPSETLSYGGVCPICGKKLTIGVQHRVEELADRPEGYHRPDALPYESLVPLPEVIASSVGMTTASKKVNACYEALLEALGTEFDILRSIPLEDVGRVAGPCVQEGIRRLRAGIVERTPGFDGEYGKIRLLNPAEIAVFSGQTSLFGLELPQKKKARPLPASAAKSGKANASTATQPLPKAAAPEDFLEELNAAQRRAVTSECAKIAVVAGPGTGKTKTLVSRILYVLREGKAKPAEVTAVTFTNQAAWELRERLEAALGSKRALRGITIGTFHSICLGILQKSLGRPVILAEDEESEAQADALLQAHQIKMSPRMFLQDVSRVKNGQEPEHASLPKEILQEYCDLRKQSGVLDYDDLLLETLELWNTRPEEVKRYKNFSWLLVDEFQDSSPVQQELLRAWLPKQGHLFVIGDPDQAIYGFRGSDAGCFDRLKEEHTQLEQITLTQNYRSTPAILRCALRLISKNPGGERTLLPQRPEGAGVRLLCAEDDFAQALFTAKEIGRMAGGIDMLEAHQQSPAVARETPRDFSEIAVLYRTHRQARLLEKCLRQESIPYVVAGRDDFLREKPVRGICAFFRFLLEPRNTDALHSCLKLLWNCPEEEVSAVLKEIRQWEDASLTEGRLEALSRTLTSPALSSWAQTAAAFFPRTSKEKPRRLLKELADRLNLLPDDPLEKFLNMSVFHKTISSLLELVFHGGEPDLKRSDGQAYASGAVTLMTLHGAKGLEFPVVFLYGVKQGILPLESKKHPVNPEEERRLFYVGMTRAREELLLLTANPPSPFLADLPPRELLPVEPERRRAMPEGKQLSLF